LRLGFRFFAGNGSINFYTDLPPDKENLAYESIEWESNVEEMLKMRYNTLKGKAFGISRGRKDGSDGWTVIFKYKDSIGRNGRAVTMNLDGSEARVEHVDFILKKVDKKL
jgi:type VI protein secretion system component Hcp